MEHYRRTAHTRFDIKFHLVWITKYHKRLLGGEVGLRLRRIVRTICAEPEVEILEGHVSRDHVHLFVSCPPHVSASYLMQRLKGKSSRKLMQEYSHLEEVVLGPAPVGPGVLRGQLGERHRRGHHGVHPDAGAGERR